MIGGIILAALVAASFGIIATPATAAVVVQIAPPAPRTEATPLARRISVVDPIRRFAARPSFRSKRRTLT